MRALMTSTMISLRTFVLVIIMGAVPVTGALAEQKQLGDLILEEPWTRATPAGAKVGAGYLSIVNTGDSDDRLTRAASPIAERVEIHTMTMENGVMRMRQLKDGLELKARSVTELRPGGFHIMFIGLKKPIKKDENLPLQLQFEKAGKVDLVMTAAAIGAMKSPHQSGSAAVSGSSSGTINGSGAAPRGSGAAAPAHGSNSGAPASKGSH